MNKVFPLLIVVLFLIGCAGVRYSPHEIKDLSPKTKEQIKDSEVALDMTQLEVRYSWGAPSAVTILKPSGEGKAKEEWLYRSGCYKNRLIFVDGKLSEIITNDPKIKKSLSQKD